MKHLHPVICRVTRKSVSDGKSEVIHLGKAYLSQFSDGISLVYHESADIENSKVTLEVNDKIITCLRQGESVTMCTWQSLVPTSISIKSSFGQHFFNVMTHQVVIMKELILVDYELMVGDEVIDRIEMKWEIKEESHEST
jgi:uncharacterized beta-barrel protein YwiB (DUF1934 family)